MSDRYCIGCGARYGTAHATNCPAYIEDKDTRIKDLEQQLSTLRGAIVEVIELLNCGLDDSADTVLMEALEVGDE